MLCYTSDTESPHYRLCVPKVFRRIVLQECHDSLWSGAHLGKTKTIDKINQRYYFRNMHRYVSLWISTCSTCQAIKRKVPNKEKIPLGVIEANFVGDLLSIDIWDAGATSVSGYQYVLTCIDGFSKWVTAIPLRNKKANTVARALYERVFTLGHPARLHSDQGPEFINETLEELCKLFIINKSMTTAYHPQGNAYAERIHQFFKNALSAFVRHDQRDWDVYLPALINVYQDSIHESLGGYSPSQVM